MPKRKIKPTNGTGQTGDGQNANHASKVLKRLLRNQARLLTVGSNTSEPRNKLKRGHLAEKENVSSVTDASKAVDLGIQVRSDNPPARRVLRSCNLRNTDQVEPIAIVEHDFNGSDKPLKDGMGMTIEVENIRHQKNLQISSISPSSIIASDENLTLINSPKTYYLERKSVKNIPFSSTPIIRPVGKSKKNGHTLSVHQNSRRQISSSSSNPSETIYSEAITCSSQFKVPTSKSAQLKDTPFSSTPMKDVPIYNNDLPTDTMAGQILPKFVLSPIRNARSKTNPIMPSNFTKDSVVNEVSAPCSSAHIFGVTAINERDALFKRKPVEKVKTRSMTKAPLQEQEIEPHVEVLECICEDEEGNSLFTDSVQKYTKMPNIEFLTSKSDNGDSGSGEYDPFKLFILHDPITTNDMPDPRTSKFRNCEMKFKEFDDLGLPLQQKKLTKKTKKAKIPVAKCDKMKCENTVGQWLQKMEEMNQEFSEIESMDLYIE